MATRRSTSSSKTLVLPPYLDVAPRFGTLRNLNNPTYGDRLARVHRLLTGTRPMPHQQYFYDVFGEVDPKTGIRIYREAYITLMRQTGKTTEVRVVKVHRALDCRLPQLVQFAAQDGIEAKKKWLQHAKAIKKSPLRERLLSPSEPVTSNGKEALTWDNGSIEIPISSRPDSGHGDTVNLGVVTEAFSQVDDRYENTIIPAMNTDPDAQFLAESTEGTLASLYWNAKLDELRAQFEAEPRAPRRVLFMDWSFAPNDDPGDPATWRRRIPSVGHTLRVEEIQHAYDRATTPEKMRLFLRGFGNVRDVGAAEGTMFEGDQWTRGEVAGSGISGPVTFALEISPDRSYTTIAIAGKSTVRGTHFGLAQRRRGTHWFVEYLVEKMREVGATTVYVAHNNPAALAAPDLERAGLIVVVLSRADIAAACAGMYDAIVNKEVTYTPGQPDLHAAVASTTWTGGDVRTFSRAGGDISAFYAVTIARYGSLLAAQEKTYDPVRNIL